MPYAIAPSQSPSVTMPHGREPTPSVMIAPPKWLSRFVLLAGGIVLTLGITVMFAWHVGNIAVIRVLPTATPMYYNTALNFVLCGIGLLAMASGWNRLARLMGSIVATLSGIILSEHFFAVDFGIDQALMTDWVRFGSLPPGRMAIAAATGFALSGVNLLAMSGSLTQRSPRRTVLVGVAGTVVATLGLITVGLYLTNLMTAEGWGHIAQAMAVHTAVGLVLVGVAFMSWVWQTEKPRQNSLPLWLPVVAGASVMTVVLLLWQALLVQQQEFSTATRTALPLNLLVSGILMALFVMLTVFLAQRAHRQAWEATTANDALQQEIAARKEMEATLHTLNVELDQRVQERTAALQESQRFLTHITDTVPALIYLYDLQQRRILYFNSQVTATLGYSSEDIQQFSSSGFTTLIHPDDVERVAARVASWTVTRDETLPEIEYRFRHKDGDWRWLQSRDVIFQRTADDVPQKILGAGQDITARKDAEEELAQHDRELARANADLRQMSYVSAHDLQEPVRQVGLYTQLLAARYRDSLDAETQEAVAFIVDGTKRMQAQFTDLMHYLEVDEQDLGVSTTDCEILLQQAFLALHDVISTSGATITHDLLPTLVANPAQLQLVLQELLDNALKFRDSTPLHVHVWAEREESGWRFAVRDNGIGIEPQSADQLFRFFRKLQRRTDYPGTGMGLAICKKIVERHGGRIWIDSQPGKETTVYFTISGGGRQ
jgi:PAS domain S-box-containing protein